MRPRRSQKEDFGGANQPRRTRRKVQARQGQFK